MSMLLSLCSFPTVNLINWGVSHYSPAQVTGQITFSTPNHGDFTIMGAIISYGRREATKGNTDKMI